MNVKANKRIAELPEVESFEAFRRAAMKLCPSALTTSKPRSDSVTTPCLRSITSTSELT